MLFFGSMPCDCATLVLVVKYPQKGGSFNFSLEHNDGDMGFFLPGGLVGAYMPEAYTNATLTLLDTVFLSVVETMFPKIPHDVL